MSFIHDAESAGFSREQAEFMDQFLAKFPHHHSIAEVVNLDDALEEAGVDPSEYQEDEDEEDEDDYED